MSYISLSIPSTDGVHRIAARVCLPAPETAVVGYFQVVHGMAEHIGRYDRFLSDLAAQGYIAFGHDHLGHGHTVSDGAELGHIAARNGWRLLADDVAAVRHHVMAAYPARVPYLLMGHSMGSFVVRTASVLHGPPDGLVVMGTGGPNPLSGTGLLVIRLVKALRGGKYRSAFLKKLIFGSYDRGFSSGLSSGFSAGSSAGSPSGSVSGDGGDLWLSADPANRDAYHADPLCGFPFSAAAMEDLVRLQRFANSRAFFSGMGDTPVLLVSGGDDPVGGHGRGVTAVYERLRKSGTPVEMKLYSGLRHEILNEGAAYGEITGDILDFAARVCRK